MLTFTITRDEVNTEEDLIARVLLGGTATLNYDYTATGIQSVSGNILTVKIPAQSTSKQILFRPVPGLVQPDLTITVTLQNDPLTLIIDGSKPSASGTLTFVGD